MEVTLDYKAVKLAEREIVLPYYFGLKLRSRDAAYSKVAKLDRESDVQADYKNYRLFSAGSAVTYPATDSSAKTEVHSTITFGTVAPPVP
jgi:hypothetical protein